MSKRILSRLRNCVAINDIIGEQQHWMDGDCGTIRTSLQVRGNVLIQL